MGFWTLGTVVIVVLALLYLLIAKLLPGIESKQVDEG